MGDNEFRSLRRPAVENSADPNNEMSDPLAELARLIGQSDPRGAFSREADPVNGDASLARALDWSGEQHAGAGHEPAGESRYDRAPAAQYSPPLSGDVHEDGHDEPYRDGDEEHAAYEAEHAGHDDAGDDEAGDEEADDAGDYADADYDENYEELYEEDRSATGRRSRTTGVVLSIVGLIVLGSAAAFGYRAMFGGSMFPALPPIIKPSSAPVKIMPNHDSQAAAPSQTAAANNSAADHLVSHEEQPVAVQAAPPRAVTTVPVVSNTPPDGVVPGAQPAPSASTLGQEAADAADSAEPTPPPPKPVHTMAIHTDQRPARAGADAASARPLSIIPGRDTEASSGSRSREADARPQEPQPSASPPAGTGGYAVQVSSQRSEAEAQATFHVLQTKYPEQLGSQHGMVRRADLGPKGVYYRSLVGPFASAEEASRLCSSLKAAGGSCIVQRN